MTLTYHFHLFTNIQNKKPNLKRFKTFITHLSTILQNNKTRLKTLKTTQKDILTFKLKNQKSKN